MARAVPVDAGRYFGVNPPPIVVVGGGPGEAAAAAILAQAGREVLVLERQKGSHDKVCGEFSERRCPGRTTDARH
ncbi:MAG: NAD(P)-binding protein [Acetobacteraceae bacterium]|nr:NAD(P)-binding protein [Acetobacteraceae bacterium]